MAEVDLNKLLLCDLIDDVIDDPNRLGTPLFNKLCGIVPMVAVEVVLVNSNNQVFMSYREDEFFAGWHFPGRILRFGNDLDSEITALFNRELEVYNFRYSLMFPLNNNKHIKRGHIVSLVYFATSTENPGWGEWFDTIPENTIEDHIDLYELYLEWRSING